METYLEAEIPEDLCKHLFLSFMKKSTLGPTAALTASGKDFNVKDMAVVASQTIFAPLSTELHFDSKGPSFASGDKDSSGRHHSLLAEKLHGLTEKLHGLGHSRSDSGTGESGKRSRAGRLIARTVLFCIDCSLQRCQGDWLLLFPSAFWECSLVIGVILFYCM